MVLKSFKQKYNIVKTIFKVEKNNNFSVFLKNVQQICKKMKHIYIVNSLFQNIK